MAKKLEGKTALVTSATLLVMFPLFVMFCVFQKQFVSSFVTSGIK